MKENYIKIEDACFSYDQNRVFQNINLETSENEIFCLMGRNGCGKSTLIDCILGTHTLNNGNIEICGKKIGEYKADSLAKKISYVPQTHDKSFPYLVRDIILMGRTTYLNALGMPGKSDLAMVKKVMEEVGISHLSDRPYTQVSGGEMQMIALARALVQDTPIIIMDEPTAHLDFYNELLFLEKIAAIIKTGEKSILMATHSPNQAFYLEHAGLKIRVALMQNGEIKTIGTPSQVLTDSTIASVYHVESYIMNQNEMKQIIPVRTII